MVENASNKKAESEKFITKFARYYTPIVVFTAIIVGIILPLFLGNFNIWFGRALIFLVISCPCALVLSVPLTFFSSIGNASKKGILIKGGNYLETLTSINSIVFDKTGTLTKGKFKIDNFFSSIGNASKKGILIKGGNYLETLTSINSIVFDKTGTLTKGKFKIDKLEPINCNEDKLLETAKIGEFYSTHPIGKAILNYGSVKIDEDYIEGYKNC